MDEAYEATYEEAYGAHSNAASRLALALHGLDGGSRLEVAAVADAHGLDDAVLRQHDTLPAARVTHHHAAAAAVVACARLRYRKVRVGVAWGKKPRPRPHSRQNSPGPRSGR